MGATDSAVIATALSVTERENHKLRRSKCRSRTENRIPAFHTMLRIPFLYSSAVFISISCLVVQCA